MRYRIERSRRRTLALHVTREAEVVVRAPRWAPGVAIRRFVEKHADWLERTLARVERQKQIRPTFTQGDTVHVWGQPVALNLFEHGGRGAEWSLNDGALTVALPTGRNSPPTVRRVLRAAYRQALDERLKAVLPKFSAAIGVAPRSFSIGYAETRWGSCSPNGALRFNARLAMLPPEILDYVIVHELAHLKELNHSKRFWAVVAAAMPDFKTRRRRLRQQNKAFSL